MAAHVGKECDASKPLSASCSSNQEDQSPSVFRMQHHRQETSAVAAAMGDAEK
jgi:hypothetical protein